MRLVPILALSLSLFTACDKKADNADKAGPTASDPKAVEANKATEPKKAEPKPAEPPKEEPPKPVTKTGTLDLEMQEVAGGYNVITPRFTQFFPAKPQVQRQDAAAPDGTTIPGAVAIVQSGERFAGLIYIPIPKDVNYNVPKGLKGARDGMLGMFEGKYDAKDDKTKLGPLDANHVVAEGSRGGHKFHIEAWIAYDEGGRTVYGLMSLRMPNDLEGVDKVKEGFQLRPDAAAAVEPVEGDVDAAGNDVKAPKKAAPPAGKKPAKAAPGAKDDAI